MIYSRNQINKAGLTLITSKSKDDVNLALDIINTWRTNHLHPLKILKNGMMKILEQNNINPVLVSQRLKRLSSIIYKLDLNNNMGLGGMQDIGGYRVVLKDVKDLNKLNKIILKNISKHKLERIADYVTNPKVSGYRSIHFVYKYYSRAENYSNARLELQIRTKLQHNWATAVETAGILTNTSLKSSQGSDEWLHFFKIVSSLFAIKENLPKLEIHKEHTVKDLMIEYYYLCKKLNVIVNLSAIRVSTKHIESKNYNSDYYLLRINIKDKIVNLKSYNKSEYENATQDYLDFEKQIIEGENAIVLVAASSLKALKKAYPSYFLDTSEFLLALEKMNANCISRGYIIDN